ncbi:hypothetical protein [Rubrolithibacter danxiaensis]|uniref:DUF7935 family protein n=1 Tax=Rubrolithibacter danxiaensis TaxID=3390805 RepID=UPI003BF7B2DC
MEVLAYLLEIIKYITAGFIVFYLAWLVIKKFLSDSYRTDLIELKKASLAHSLPLRLQAYERLILFLDRINPSNMMLRLHVTGATVQELHNLALSDIRAEYQHNVTQQLYVSGESWKVIQRIKDDTISLINNAAKGLPADAASFELSKALLLHLANMEESPYEAASAIIKKEIQQLF